MLYRQDLKVVKTKLRDISGMLDGNAVDFQRINPC